MLARVLYFIFCLLVTPYSERCNCLTPRVYYECLYHRRRRLYLKILCSGAHSHSSHAVNFYPSIVCKKKRFTILQDSHLRSNYANFKSVVYYCSPDRYLIHNTQRYGKRTFQLLFPTTTIPLVSPNKNNLNNNNNTEFCLITKTSKLILALNLSAFFIMEYYYYYY